MVQAPKIRLESDLSSFESIVQLFLLVLDDCRELFLQPGYFIQQSSNILIHRAHP